MCHLRKAKGPLTVQENKLPCRITCLNESEKLPMFPMESFPLLITDRQGLIEIHILRLQLSTSVSTHYTVAYISYIFTYIRNKIINSYI